MGKYLIWWGLLLPLGAWAQRLNIPPASAPAHWQTTVGLTELGVSYSRPGVKGRKIFGGLVPYHEVWRAGANEATRLRWSEPVQIGKDIVPAGAYALYAIPGPAEWTWILYADTTLWGARNYDVSREVLRLTAPTERLPERVETLEYRLMNVTHTTADLVLEWEYTRVRLPLAFDTHAQVEAAIGAGLRTGEDYYRAARYYFDNDLDLAQAQRWMERRLALDGEQFGVMRYQALVAYALGDTATARRVMERSLDLAHNAKNEHYIRLNTQSLVDWLRIPAELPADSILDRSIRYHDPLGRWGAIPLQLSLYEERPGSADNYRLTDLLIDLPNEVFEMHRRTGRERIYRRSAPEGCVVKINGADKPFVQAQEIHTLRCNDNQGYRNYYTFLWGLPMKLRDPGAVVHPGAFLRDFFGRTAYEVKVTFDPTAGSDTWYVYFDPDTYALIGYRFYHHEAANDGEYILLEGGELEVQGLRLPRRRLWYTHANNLYLGADELLPVPAAD